MLKHKHNWKISNTNVQNPNIYFECHCPDRNRYMQLERTNVREFLKGRRPSPRTR